MELEMPLMRVMGASGGSFANLDAELIVDVLKEDVSAFLSFIICCLNLFSPSCSNTSYSSYQSCPTAKIDRGWPWPSCFVYFSNLENNKTTFTFYLLTMKCGQYLFAKYKILLLKPVTTKVV